MTDQTPWYAFTLLTLDSILIAARPYYRAKIILPTNSDGLEPHISIYDIFSIRTLFHLAGYGWLDGGRLGV